MIKPLDLIAFKEFIKFLGLTTIVAALADSPKFSF